MKYVNTIVGLALIVYAVSGSHDYIVTGVIAFAGGWILATKSKDE